MALKSDGTIVGWGRNDYGQATPPCALNFVVAVAAGNGHSLVLKSDRTVVGWGDNFTGQASPPGDLTNVVAVAAGGYLSLALKVDGTVVHWGDNAGGVTTPPAGLSNVVAIATGPGHSLALKSDGRVVGWGDNYGGRVTPPVGLSNVVAVAAGGAHSLALKSDGTVVGWGSDYNEDGYYRGQATPPVGLSNVVAVAAGGYYSLALKGGGTVVGWGDNSWGQATVPVGLSNVAAVAAGEYHSLALKGDSTVVGWGRNDYGQATTPGGLTNVAAIAAGGYHSLALVAQFPFPATVTLSDLFQTYDGTAKLVSAATSPSNLAVIVTYDDSLSAPTNVGSYTVVGRINDTNYQGSATNTLVIQKATAIVMLSKLTQFYDGTAKPVSVVTAPPGLAVNVSYNGSVDAPTNIGRYAVVGTVNDLNGEGSATGILAIVAAGLIGWWPGDGNAYDFAGTNNALLRGGATFVTGEVGPGFSLNGTNAFIEVPDSSLLYPGTNSFSLSAWVETTNAMGTREIFTRYENGGVGGSGIANSDYELYLTSGKLTGFLRDSDKGGPNSGGQELVGTRNLADGVFHYVVLVRDIQNTQMVLYVDGAVEASAAIDSHVLGAIRDDDTLPDPLYLGAGPLGQVNGQYANFFQGVIDEAQYWNRALSTAEVQAMYAVASGGERATATLTLSNLIQTYDGSAKAVSVTTEPPDLPVQVTYNGVPDAPTNAGNYTVIGRVDSSNYFGSATSTLIIQKGTATVTLSNLLQTYDGTAKPVSATTTPPGLGVELTYNGLPSAGTNAGSYTVIGTVNNSNYVGSATNTLVIQKGTAVVMLSNLLRTYDGTAKPVSASTTPPGLAVELTYNGLISAPTNVDNYTVVGSVNNSNYVGSATNTLVIQKGTATVTPCSLLVTYDGTAKPICYTTAPPGLAVDVTYSSGNAPTNVGSYTVIATVNDLNYQGGATNILVIQKATATVTLGSLLQTYDGTAKPVSATTTPPGLVVELTYNGLASPPTNAGNYTVIGAINSLNYQGSTTNTLAIILFAGGCVLPPPAGLVSWWPGDGSGNDLVGTNNGLLRGGATFATGEVGPGFSLNGTNAFIEVPDSSLLYPGTNSFSLSAWVETTNAVGTREIFTRYENGGLNSGGSANSDYELYLTSGKLSGFLRDTDKGGTNSGGQELVGTRNVADGVFHYVALVRDVQNTQMVLYVDGAVEASAAIDSHVLGTITDDDGHPDSLLLGAAPVGQVSGQYVNFFQGVIDEAQYWNRALSTAEVQAMYAAGSAGLCRPAVPARLATPAWLGDGSLRLAFTNNGGAIFSVLASTNAALRLSNWTVLGVAAEVSAGHYQFTDPQATNNPRRFYRVRSP